MRVRTRISIVRQGGIEYRVIRPARPLVHAALYAEPHGVPTEPHSLAMFVGRREAVVLTALWGLLTRSPHSLLYLPMRHTAAPEGLRRGLIEPVGLDLVLAHHRLQFSISRWKGIRGCLGEGRLHTADVPPAAYNPTGVASCEPLGQHEQLRVGIAANTVFLTAGGREFRDHGNLLWQMLLEAGPYVKSINGRYHYCVELGDHNALPWFKRRRRFPTQVHIQYCPRWRAFP
jgi:hypothetical protein